MDKSENLSVKRQCALLDVNRSTVYYDPSGESEFNLTLMRGIDQILMETPEYGSRKLSEVLSMRLGEPVNRKRVQRLMREMGVEAMYPRKRTTIPGDKKHIHPYLLKGMEISRPNQVWCADITYLPVRGGYVYLFAIMDWCSRRIISWEISNTLDVDFCLVALAEAIALAGCAPEIFNTDQGSQFTSEKWISALAERDIRISMDGKGRWVDNVLIERFWRTLKHDDVYPRDYESVPELEMGVARYIERYNKFRPHSALGKKTTPDMVYFGRRKEAA